VNAQRFLAEIHRRVADQHSRAADLYLNHASIDRMAGHEELAAEMEKLAKREREREENELRIAKQAESR
jgi:hypothetical protein